LVKFSGNSLGVQQKLYITFACSVRGASHIKNGKPCQDASFDEKGNNYRFAALADGHGGDPYFRSEFGSRFAIQALRSCVFDPSAGIIIKKLSAQVENKKVEKERERIILQLKKSVINRWNMMVCNDIDVNPFTEKELNAIPAKYMDEYRAGKYYESAYGTTLIAVLWTDTFLLALQIGDGSCVMLNTEAEFTKPVPVDEKCFLNVTSSLCDRNAIESFRHYYTKDLPAAMIIASDGIDDCFAGTEKLFDFYRVILSSFNEKDEENAKAELNDYFPRLSAKGSGDDVSIGLIIDSEILRILNIETEKQKEEGNA
jgi:serine/threonine protein phosphatase PrpC